MFLDKFIKSHDLHPLLWHLWLSLFFGMTLENEDFPNTLDPILQFFLSATIRRTSPNSLSISALESFIICFIFLHMKPFLFIRNVNCFLLSILFLSDSFFLTNISSRSSSIHYAAPQNYLHHCSIVSPVLLYCLLCPFQSFI